MSARSKARLCDCLLASHPWDVFICVFGECHRGEHLLWPRAQTHLSAPPPRALLEVHQAVDAAIGQILATVSLANTSALLLSPNGMREDFSQNHFMQPIMDRVNRQFLEREGILSTAVPPRQQRSVVRALRERIPHRMQQTLGQLAPIAVRDLIVNRTFTAGHDWPSTPGLALRADTHSYIRFNICGRERDGMLPAGSDRLSRYADWVQHCFRSLRIPGTNERPVREISLTSTVFPGIRAHFLPDMVVTWSNAQPVSRICSDTLGEIDAPPNNGRAGNHTAEGFCVVSGSGSLDVTIAPPGDLVDLAPMIVRQFPAAGTAKHVSLSS